MDELKKIVAQMMREGASQEEIKKFILTYNQQNGSVEKKNILQNAPQNSTQKNTDSVLTNGSSDSPENKDTELLDKTFPEFFGNDINNLPDIPEELKKGAIADNDFDNSFRSGVKRAGAGLAATPNAVVQSLFTLVAPQEVKDFANKLDSKKRSDFINDLVNIGSPLKIGTLSKKSDEEANNLLKESKELRQKMTQFDTAITQDLLNGNFAQAGRRLAVEGVGTIPSVLQTLIPVVGLASVGVGEGALKLKELQEEGEKLSGAAVGDAAVTGLAEAIFEKFTKGQTKRLIGSLNGKGINDILSGVAGFVQGLLLTGKTGVKEGLTETATGLTEKIADRIFLGKAQEAEELMLELADQFLVGFGFGGALKGGEVTSNILSNIAKSNEKAKVDSQNNKIEGNSIPLNIEAIDVGGEATDSAQEIERIKKLPLEQEDGVTLNLDGSKYTGEGVVVPILSRNFTKEEFTQENIKEFIEANKDRIGSNNVKIRFFKFEGQDLISVDINVVTSSKNKDVAVDFARQAGQESVFDLGDFTSTKTGKDGLSTKDFTAEEALEITNSLVDGKFPNIEGFAPQVNISSTNSTTETTTPIVAGKEETKVNKKIKKLRKKGLSNSEIIESIKNKTQKRTAKILLERQKSSQLTDEQALKESNKTMDKIRQEMKKPRESFSTIVKKKIDNAMDNFIDRQFSVKNLFRQAGLDAKGKKLLEKTESFMVAKLGSSSRAKQQVEKIHKITFDRLSQEDSRTLEELILNRRIIAIDKNRQDRGLDPVEHVDGTNSIKAQKAINGLKTKLGEKKFNELNKRADNVFNEYRRLLESMRDEGLIKQETFDIFVDVDYQPREIISFFKDMDQKLLLEEVGNFETSSLSKEQIKSFKGGSTDSQNIDSQFLLHKTILTRVHAQFQNRLNNVFATEIKEAFKTLDVLKKKNNLTKAEKKQLDVLEKLSSNIKVDKIIGFNENGNPIYSLDKIDTLGFKAVYFYKNGVPNRIWMRESFHNKFTDTNNQLLDSSVKESIEIASGTRVLKTLATGRNPLFLVTNVPRDLAFALAFSKEFGNGAKTIVPLEAAKLIKGFGKGFASALTENQLFEKYIEFGGGMDFLTLQGRYGKGGFSERYEKNRFADGLLDFGNIGAGRKVKDFFKWINKINTASEFATRIAVFDRSIKNQLKGRDINDLSKEEQDALYTNAVQSARELTDFNQGGKVTKALDTAVPYLNAGTQGTRAFVENYSKRPVETTSRLIQITAGFTGMTITAAFGLIRFLRDDDDEETKGMTTQQIYFETLNNVSSYDLTNYYIFPEGRKDAKGNWIYNRVAKSQALTPFINTTEHFLRKLFSETHGVDYKQDLNKELMRTIQLNILPIDINFANTVTGIPAVDAALAWNGIDAYTGKPLSNENGRTPAELEGLVDPRVEGFFKDIGEKLEISPLRLKAATESLITTPSTNPAVGFGYLGAEIITGNDKEGMAKGLLKAMGKRVRKSTTPFNFISKLEDQVSDEIVDLHKNHIKMESVVREAVKKAKVSGNGEEMINTLEKIFKENPDDIKKAVDWAISEFNSEKVSPLINFIKRQVNKKARAIILAELYGDSLLKEQDTFSEREKKILIELVKEKAIDNEVISEYEKLFK